MTSTLLARRFALAAALTLAAGCAEERPPIDRVQPNAIDKSFLVGALADPNDDPEFFMRVTVVDVDSGANQDGLFTSSDAQPVSRVRFEISEKLLLARLTYERVDDLDHPGVRRVTDGQIVAAYAIESHFDIQRAYNESTGEELNVVDENTTDRPWNERAFMRVDWSQNLVTTAYELDSLAQLGIYYGIEWEPVAYTVNDPASPDAPAFDLARGYFDVTNKALAKPQLIHDPEWGDYPACWVYGRFPTTNCNPSELTLRQAYLRVEDRDYEPLDYDGARMDLFGYFTDDRFGYDRRYGVVDDRWHRFAARWNIWHRSHASPAVVCGTPETTPAGKDVHRDENRDGTEDECAAVGRGSRCDEFRGECTLPLRDRQVRTIAWHVNEGFPEDLFAGAADSLKAWSDSIRVAVVAGRLAECRRTGQRGCEQKVGWPARWSDDFNPPYDGELGVPPVFVLCHNPVDPAKGDDLALCGPAGTRARLGDLRFNFLNVITDPQDMSPWGIMMDAEDPLTGEKIAGSVNQWGAVLDRAASTLVDLLGLLNGEIAPDEFIAGQNVSEWVERNRPGGPAERGQAMPKEELASRREAFDPKALAPLLDGLGSVRPGTPPALRREARLKALLNSGRLGPGNQALTARMESLRGTRLESALVSPELAQAAGLDPTRPLNSEELGRASPLRRMNPLVRRNLERASRLGHARRHSCRLEAPEADHLLGLAKVAARLFPAPDPTDAAAVADHRRAVWNWARQQYSRSVLAHELGHSMGLRHNFAASFDAFNYDKGYWQLRTRNGAVTQPCPEGTTDGGACVGPRWLDPVSQEEIDGNISRFATTSVMDYPGDQNQDMNLPGSYDRAAIRFGYAGVADVWNEPGVSVADDAEDQAKAFLLTAFTTSPGLFGVYYFPPVDVEEPYRFIHYSQYQKEFGVLGECRDDASEGAILGKRCAGPALDVVDWRDLRDFASDPDYAGFSWGVNVRAVDDSGRVRRGFLFSSDEYADSGNVPSFTDDAGADAYEQIRFLEAAYENRYILDAFRRGRVKFNSYDTVAHLQSRYLDPIQLIAKTFAFGAVLDGDPAKPSDELLQDGYYGPLALGATVALDLFARILTRPEPGYYCPWEICGGARPWGVTEDLYVADPAPLPQLWLYDFQVGLGDGRYLHNDYDYSRGYWWSDYQTQVGAYYEKIWATYYLAEAYDTFISNSKEDFTDSRYKNVSFATVFPEQVRRLYNALLTGDYGTYAPWVVVPEPEDETPLGTLRYPRWHDAQGLGGRPPRAKLADPNYGFSEQLHAMVWGTVYFPTNWSSSFLHDARIAALASETPDWPASETLAFHDPETGVTYKAHAVGTEVLLGEERQRGAGARMLEWANLLLSEAYLVEREVDGSPKKNLDGSPILVLDAAGKPQKDPAKPGAAGALRKYVDTVDMFRQLVATMELPLNPPPEQQ